MDKKETLRDHYWEKFKDENQVTTLFSPKSKKVGTKLVELMKKEGLMYDQAYAALQHAYELIKYESNFLKLK